MAVCWVILRGQQIYTIIQAVHSLIFIVAKWNFFSVVTWRDIIKYLQKCEGCTHFCEILYKALNGLSPEYLTNLLSRYNPTRSLRSQNSGLVVVARIAKSNKGGRTFSYLAPKLWNSLPDNVRGSDTLSLFKSRLKTHIFSQSFI